MVVFFQTILGKFLIWQTFSGTWELDFKDKIELELERFVSKKIFQPIKYSEWISPLLPVAKTDWSIGICGDYKVSVNNVVKCFKYPVSKTKDLRATLNRGKRLSKLDLSYAYHSLLLHEDRRNF